MNDYVLAMLAINEQKWLFFVQELHYTLFEIFIFCPKIQRCYPEKIVHFLAEKLMKMLWILDFLAVDNFDFTRKIVKKILDRKTREIFLSKLSF